MSKTNLSIVPKESISTLRALLEEQFAIHVHRNPLLLLDQEIDFELFDGLALRYVEELEAGPHTAQLCGATSCLFSLIRHTETRSRNQLVRFAVWIERRSRRAGELPPLESIITALQELRALELTAGAKQPAWQRYMDNAEAANSA